MRPIPNLTANLSIKPIHLMIPVLAVLVGLAGCTSTSSNTPAPAPIPQPVPPPPIKEAPLPVRANLRAELAAGYYERGQMDVALQELTEAVKLDPTNAKIYNVYGLVYATLGQDADAARNFRKALELSPNDSEFRQNWGWYLCTHAQAKESIPEFERAISNPLYKTPEIALINAGRCAGSLGETQRAEQFFRRALNVSPSNPEAAYSLSQLAYKEGRLPEARALMKPVMQQNNPSAEELVLGMCIERKLGDRSAEASYVSQLRNRYPNSPETKSIATGACE
ncbi:MAG: type IV pilus biogenesis/stability protein PilW [Betaproteobacteria bacterium]